MCHQAETLGAMVVWESKWSTVVLEMWILIRISTRCGFLYHYMVLIPEWSTVVLVDSQIRILVWVRKKKIQGKIQVVGVP